MDNTNPGSEERTENKKVRLLFVAGTLPTIYGSDHLKGEGPALGIIPITQNNDCRWGCIDIDEYNFNHLEPHYKVFVNLISH